MAYKKPTRSAQETGHEEDATGNTPQPVLRVLRLVRSAGRTVQLARVTRQRTITDTVTLVIMEQAHTRLHASANREMPTPQAREVDRSRNVKVGTVSKLATSPTPDDKVG